MSRKKILLKKALMQNARGKGETHTSKWPAPTQDNINNIRPERATGSGRYLERVATAYAPGPHGSRGNGNVCSLPAGDRFDARAKAALRGKS